MDKYEYVIIGNGILGIHLGRLLKSKNKNYIILEKSKNVGGRFASRRFEDFKFNFGAKSFNWDESFFIDEINHGLSKKQLIYSHGLISPTSTFNEWTKDLANSLNVSQFEVEKIDSSFNGEYIINDNVCAQRVIVTAPAPQAYELVKDLGDYEYLKDVSYKKESYYMYSTQNEYEEVEGLTLISSDLNNGLNYFFCSVDLWDEMSREELKVKFDNDINPLESFAHKWRYSKVEDTIDYKQRNPNIFCLGDYYEGEVKGSFNSAQFLKSSI
jgi:predicted NAD/FAD-dependent oxidoreductase